jgi:hypothetical protein
MKNKEIVYDVYEKIPFDIPFNQILASEIDIYLPIDNSVGLKKYKKSAQHCQFDHYPKMQKKNFTEEEGIEIYKALSEQGFTLFPRYIDTLAEKGKFMRLYRSDGQLKNHGKAQEKVTNTIVDNEAWTSGIPLLADDYEDVLTLARECGYRVITLPFHGLLSHNLRLNDRYPFKDVFSAIEFEQVVGKIRRYNEKYKGNGNFCGFSMNASVAIGRHNCSRQSLQRYMQYFNKMGVKMVRFNPYYADAYHEQELELSRQEKKQVFKDIKWLHTNVELRFQLGISGDFGTKEGSASGLSAYVNGCRAGRQLFGIIPITTDTVISNKKISYKKIGNVVGCANTFEPVLGALIRCLHLNTQKVSYKIIFFQNEIEKLEKNRMNGQILNGCLAGELQQMQTDKCRKQHCH